MPDAEDLFQSRKFYTLVISLVGLYFGFANGVLSAEQAIVGAISALQVYSLGTAISG